MRCHRYRPRHAGGMKHAIAIALALLASPAAAQQFPTIPAVRNDRVYGCRADELLRPGPRAPETLETIARFIHPERFAAVGR